MPLNEILERRKNKIPHLIIEARAGTGKTTTLIEGLKLVTGKGIVGISPSYQQDRIWEAMQKSESPKSICFVAFNKSIATELQERVPEGCQAMTMHSMGFKAIREYCWHNSKKDERLKVNNYRVQDIIAELLDKSIHEIRRKDSELLKATEKLVGLCKMNLVGFGRTIKPSTPLPHVRGSGDLEQLPEAITAEELQEIASHYDVELNSNSSRVFDLVPQVLERCKEVEADGCIDFNDMIWLPVVLDIPVFRYDLLLVDEAQDLNNCQQQLALKAGRRLILCGDPKQAIYGFAGADSNSMDNMMRELSITNVGCEYLQLTVTRRCGKAIVKEAQKIVPDFEAHRSCCDGKILRASFQVQIGATGDTKCPKCHNSFQCGIPAGNPDLRRCASCGFIFPTDCYRSLTEDGDMILCRVNAPLVSECFKFLRSGRKANIQGRDVGQGLISTIRKMKATTVIDLQNELGRWLYNETEKERCKKNPSESRLIALQDRHDCICCFAEGESTVENVIEKIESIFTDDKNGTGIMLSSVHKAKGLEAKRVFILQPEEAKMPHPMAKSSWQKEQEYNLKYVAITRAIEELVWVS